MTLASLLAMDFSQFGPVEWGIFGGVILLVLIAFIVGCKKGFSNMSLRPISWAAACAAFVLLDLNLHQVGVDLFGGMFPAETDPVVIDLLASTLWALAAVLARGIVFGSIAGLIACSKKKKLKKAAGVDYREKYTGEEVLPNENKAYKTTAINGKIKPGPLNRLFGGIFAILNTAVVVAILASITFIVLNMTPVAENMSDFFHEDGSMFFLWNFVHTHFIDFLLIALFCVIVAKGWRDGVLNALRTVVCALLKIAVIIGAFYLPFSPVAMEGEAFEFLHTGAVNLANLIPLTETVGLDVMVVVMKIAFGIVLAIVGSLLVKLIKWLLGKLLGVVDNVSVLWFLDGVLGAIVYAVLALAVIFLLALVLYSVDYLFIEPIGEPMLNGFLFSKDSLILGNFYKMFNVTATPTLESVWGYFI